MTYTNTPPLADLISQMAQGSTEALSQFYTATHSDVYAFALSLLSDSHHAEDVMQETYIRAYHGAAGYTHMEKPMAWLMTITKNLAFMKLRERKDRYEELPEGLSYGGFEGHSLQRLDLQRALDRLGGEEREIVVLHAVAGLKHREIAALLGMPLPTVLSKYHRALSKLRTYLKGEG